MRTSRILAGGVALATGLAVTVGTATAATPTDTSKLRQAVKAENIFGHLVAFQKIADANDDTRASGMSGYDASADYVVRKLEAAGYDATRQEFDFPFFQETAPPSFARTSPTPRTYVEGTDFFTMEYSGSGNVSNGVVQSVDLVLPPTPAPSSTSGCEDSDFDSFTAGNVALIQRGTCTFGQKAQNAEANGASGVIIFNEGQPGRTDVLNGTLGGPGSTIPVVGTTFEVGNELAGISGATVNLSTTTTSEIRHTENVLADTPGGSADNTVVVGAHLDSVPEGPGINDNGSGTATILEIALQMAKTKVQPDNKVRFAFWGAEESGLLGAEHYVSTLTPQQQSEIMLNLNFDMVGSPNYVRFVYDGDGSDTPTAGPPGSAEIEQVFNDHFTSEGLASAPTAFDGRSDYGPFIAVGIPAGGLFTGAEGEKTEAQQAVYGGVAGASYDPCYHQACDSRTPVADGADADLYRQLKDAYDLSGNVNMEALSEMSDAAAHTTLTFAMESLSATASVNSLRATERAASSMEYKGGHLQK